MDGYNKDVEILENKEKVIEGNISSRRQLFASPYSSFNTTSMVNDVTLINNIDKSIVSPFTDDIL